MGLTKFKKTCIGFFVIKFVDFLKIQYFNYLFSPYNLTVTILVMLLVSKRLAHLKDKLINGNMYFVQVIKVIFYNLLKVLFI